MPTRFEGDCFSPLAAGRLASLQRAPSPSEAAHLAGCSRCADLLQTEILATHAAAAEPLPLWLAQAHPTRRNVFLRQRRTWVSALVAACLLVVVGLSLRVQEHPALLDPVKGSLQLSGAVKDAAGHVRKVPRFDQTNTDDPGPLAALRPGEVLQLHLQTPSALRVTVRDADTGQLHYDGEVPADGWLPLGIEADRGAPMHLTLRACPTQHRCQTWDLR